MPSRTEVEKLNATISVLRNVLDAATQEVIRLDRENGDLKKKLHRKWNGRVQKFQCPICRRWVKLIEAELDMNDQILYVVGECRTHGRVTPTGRWTVEDLTKHAPDWRVRG